MSKLPTVDGQKAIAVFTAVGFEVDRIRSSHHVMKRDGHPFNVVVPVHGSRPIAKGTLRAFIRAAGMTVDEFVERLTDA